jgi:3-keto-5-aminohexanoate cleavage enzyme
VKLEKLIIGAAITGGEYVTKQLTPYVPCTVEEIAEEAYRCWETGASIIHLHAKDPETGGPIRDPRKANLILREYIKEIKKRCDVIINVTTGGGRGQLPPTELDEVIRERLTLGQEISSLNMGTINIWVEPITDYFFVNTTSLIERWAKYMMEANVKPELEVYDTGMINTAITLLERGVLKEPPWFQFVMVGRTGMSPTVRCLQYCVDCLPKNSIWSVCALGKWEIPMATAAILLGGHVRVGLEDNIYIQRGILAKSNAELVAKVVRIAKEIGREIATPDEARRILGLKK